MAARAEEAGVKKAASDPLTVFVLSVLAGAFISFGAIFATTVAAGDLGDDGRRERGPVRRVALWNRAPAHGARVLLGLILVIVGGAELFTGSNMIVMAWASRKVKTRDLLANWAMAFAGNFVGAIATAALMFVTTQYTFGGGSVGLVALSTANAKASLAFVPAWRSASCATRWSASPCGCAMARARPSTASSRLFRRSRRSSPPASSTVSPIAISSRSACSSKPAPPSPFWASIGKTAADFPGLTWSNFLVGNLLPVTIGNIIGGSIMVAAVYWFVYLRTRTS